MPPDISIVVPLYNKAPEIARCVRSVLAQTVANFELIVIDDGSTDDGGAVVASFADERLTWLRQENSGLAATRNRGAAMASARIVAFVDADDEWLPNHLESILSVANANPEAGLIATGYWISRSREWKRRVRLPSRFFRDGTSLVKDYYAIPDGKILPSGTAVDKHCLAAAGGYQKMFGEDIDMYLRMAAITPFAFTRTATAVWHLDAQSRMCVENAASPELYRMGGLDASVEKLREMQASPGAIERAQAYVVRRERWAVMNTLLQGDAPHARHLYSVWKEAYGADSLTLKTILGLPDFLTTLLGWAYHSLVKTQSSLAYARDLWLSRRTFSGS